MKSPNYLLLGTRKGLIVYRYTIAQWKHDQTHFLGIPVSLTFIDQRNDIWWACLDHGHWGRKLNRSKDQGKTWEEVEAPKFADGIQLKDGQPASVNYIWAMTGGGDDRPDTLYIGTDPGGLFKSDNNGDNWQLVESLWNHPTREKQWFGGGRDLPGIHSILVDPRNSDHIQIGISVAGVFKTTDGGATWHPSNKGLTADFLPDPNAEVGQDPHLVVQSPSNPDVLWQQNHCGIFVTHDCSENWSKVSEENGPADFGFAVAVNENNPDQAWVIPGISDQVRTAVDLALCVCRTDDGGKTWQDFRKGLPQENCFDIVYRHSLANLYGHLVFGTTTGNVYVSQDLAMSWEQVSSDLPMIYSVEMV